MSALKVKSQVLYNGYRFEVVALCANDSVVIAEQTTAHIAGRVIRVGTAQVKLPDDES
jgi:hypothetical protein